MGERDKSIWRGKRLEELTEPELEELAAELTSDLRENDPMVHEVLERLRVHRRRQQRPKEQG